MTNPTLEAEIDGTEFDHLRDFVRSNFAAIPAAIPLFTTDATGLFDVYLSAFPESERQQHNCNCCRQFIERFGGLVTIDEMGSTFPAMWIARDYTFPRKVNATQQFVLTELYASVQNSEVTGIYFNRNQNWGTEEAGGYTHFHVRAERPVRDRLNSDHELHAKSKQDYATLTRALVDFPQNSVKQALNYLKSEALFRGQQFVGPAQFLADLHDKLKGIPSRSRDYRNIVWLAVAAAAPGWASPRSSMIGTLLEDIQKGYDSATVAARFKAKVDPTRYMRPSSAPAAGNIEEAERVVAKLGIASALRRRFARIEDVVAIWTPTIPEPEQEQMGLFDHLKPKAVQKEHDAISGPITMAKFAATVMPGALEMQMRFAMSGTYGFGAMLTAVDPDAPPILQWDRLEKRNPVSWYTYASGTGAHAWSLPVEEWINVTAICNKPSTWFGVDDHRDPHAMFLLQGAKDRREPGLALFPEILTSELHGIRATIEAFSQDGKAEGREEATACGLIVGRQGARNAKMRVRTALGWSQYTIDRWD